MIDNDTKRLSRLVAILTQLQAKRLLTAKGLAEKFQVTTRTIYRDIRALEQAGVPVLTEEGKGFTLMEGYRLPPIMITEEEANALITAEQIIQTNRDASLVKEYSNVIIKIKSVLTDKTRNKAELLSNKIVIKNNYEKEKSSNYLSLLQQALTNYLTVKIEYSKAEGPVATQRVIEPFFLYNSTQENWIIIAYCRLKKDFRAFRLDRISKLEVLSQNFKPHTMTIPRYFESYKK